MLGARRLPRGALLGCAALVGAILSFGPSTAAQPSSLPTSSAASLFDEGRHLLEERRFAAACAKFTESKRLEPGIGVSLWLADCLESNGQTASAREEFLAALDLAEQHGDPRQAIARARANALLPRLSRIVLVVPGAAKDAVEVSCDGTSIPSQRWASGFYVDPGLHHLQATVAGRPFWEADVSVARSPSSQTLTVPGPPAGPDSAAPWMTTRSETPPRDQRFSGSAQDNLRIAAVTTGGVGLLAIGLGIYFGLEAKHDNDESLAPGLCGASHCTTMGYDLRESATTNATAADIAFGVGGAAALGSVLLYALSRRRPEPSMLRVGRGTVALEVRF
jgi:uncharacterized protein (TIGR03382 family)